MRCRVHASVPFSQPREPSSSSVSDLAESITPARPKEALLSLLPTTSYHKTSTKQGTTRGTLSHPLHYLSPPPPPFPSPRVASLGSHHALSLSPATSSHLVTLDSNPQQQLDRVQCEYTSLCTPCTRLGDAYMRSGKEGKTETRRRVPFKRSQSHEGRVARGTMQLEGCDEISLRRFHYTRGHDGGLVCSGCTYSLSRHPLDERTRACFVDEPEGGTQRTHRGRRGTAHEHCTHSIDLMAETRLSALLADRNSSPANHHHLTSSPSQRRRHVLQH